MQHIPRWTIMVAVGCTGCQDWPRHANLPQDTATPVLPGSVLPTQVEWVDGATVIVPTLQPVATAVLPLGVGLTWQGSLIGAGSLAGTTAGGDPDTGCGLTWDHPPVERGAYVGQTHWLGLVPEAVGTMCATASFEDPEVHADLLLYDLSQCGVPQGPWLDPDSEAVVGLGTDARTAWRLPVVAGSPVGLAVTAAAPDAAEDPFTYRLAVALIARGTDGLDGECPLPPEGL